MYIDAEKDGPKWASKNDNRITKVGKVIRKIRLDELPQIINILNGDMSLVGPRPERAYFYKEFEREIPDFKRRLEIVPGLTGWAQVNGGYDLTPNEKLQYDLEYMEKNSLLFDIYILFLTVKVIFSSNGAR